jgi:hypothetical protein
MTIFFGAIALGCLLYGVMSMSMRIVRTEERLDRQESETQSIRQWLDRHVQGVSMREDIEDDKEGGK